MRKQENKYILILLGICVLSLMAGLGNTLFNTKGEPREAVVALSMLKYGNWILPVNNGVDIAYKPPFFHWCIAVLSLLTGHVTEFTSRLPSALALTVMVVASFKFYARRRSPYTAMLAALTTLTAFEVHRAGTNCRVDMMLSALIVIALYQLYRWHEHGMRGLPSVAILCMSGAFLTKGPVGILLPCLVAFVFAWIRGARLVRLLMKFVLMALAACILPACWYLAAYAQGGDAFLQLVYEENVLRFLGKMSYASHVQPMYYNFLTVLSGYVPYTLLVLMSLFVLHYRRPAGGLKSGWDRLRNYVKDMNDTRLFSLLAIVIIFVFYCIPKSKRSVYLLPIYPFIAYFLAEYIIYLSNRHLKVLRAFGYTVSTLGMLLCVALLAVRTGLVPDTLFHGKHAAENIAYLNALKTTGLGFSGVVAVAMPLIAALVFWFFRKKSLSSQVYSISAVILAVMFSLDGFYIPTVLNTKSDKPVALKIKQIAGDQRIYSYRTDKSVGDMMHPFTIDFYLDDNMVPVEAVLPRSGYLLSGDDDIRTFKATYPQYNVTEVVDFKHKSCDDKKMLHLYHIDTRQKLLGK